MKRISFSESDASKLYELCLEHFQEYCGHCIALKERLEKFIGDKEKNRINRAVKRSPYCQDYV